MTEETWRGRDLPVLQSLARHFDENPSGHDLSLDAAEELSGLPHEDFIRALTNLGKARPSYIEGLSVNDLPYPVRITGITERALRDAGQWPSTTPSPGQAAFTDAEIVRLLEPLLGTMHGAIAELQDKMDPDLRADLKVDIDSIDIQRKAAHPNREVISGALRRIKDNWVKIGLGVATIAPDVEMILHGLGVH